MNGKVRWPISAVMAVVLHLPAACGAGAPRLDFGELGSTELAEVSRAEAWQETLAESGSHPAEQEEALRRATRVTLGSEPGIAGSMVTVPVYLTTRDAITSLTSEIGFPGDLLSFIKVEKGLPLLSTKTEVEAKVDSGEDPSRSALRLVLKTAEGSSGALPNGVILHVSFRVADKATPGEVVLSHKAVAYTRESKGQPADNVTAFDGKIKLEHKEKQFISGCFFYMH